VPNTASYADPVLVCEGHDNRIRWRDGERLHHLFETRCDRLVRKGNRDHLAVDAEGVTLTYVQLDERANQLARHLTKQGARAGDRIGLLFDGSAQMYVSMLAVLKLHAAYVPLDVGFPADRLAFIAQDAAVSMLVTMSHLRGCLESVDVATLCCVDEEAAAIDRQEPYRLTAEEIGETDSDLAYIIYTSGSTGRPKGVAIEHPAICNFVRVAQEVYGIFSTDRVYQGMTIAFDFSVEEIWVPFWSGATLVPRPPGPNLLGRDLSDYLRANGVTAMCCVPTLLATIDDELPNLRFLLVSGETCPCDLIERWHRAGRTFLNVYGPTEAAVTATWTRVRPSQSVTIGVPLPTYSIVILKEGARFALPPGETGEIGIAGICLSSGYVNRDDLTERAFIPDFLGIENNASGRIYRTGDLGRINEQGQIEYLGRIDTQVKISGYRIELAEIESVMRHLPEIAQAVVDTHERAGGLIELVGYYTLRPGAEGRNGFHTHLVETMRGRLPSYMVPSCFEELPELPTLPSGKVDRKRLPPPSGARYLANASEMVAPDNDTEAALAEAFGELVGAKDVSVEAHFFDDLGANSLLLAQFCARVRDRLGDTPAMKNTVAMKDVYQHPTVRSLATFLKSQDVPQSIALPSREPVHIASTLSYVGCAMAQLMFYIGAVLLGSYAFVVGFDWIGHSANALQFYDRAVDYGFTMFVVLSVIPIMVKWMVIGRFKERTFPIWGLTYLRFWTAKQAMRLNPMGAFAGSPLYSLYLRSMGAKIGRNTLVLTRRIVCTDLIEIGDNTVLREGVSCYGYKATGGRIRTGRTTIGSDVIVGEASLLDICTRLEDGAQLAHASALHEGQVVPACQRYHGSGAEETSEGWNVVEPRQCGSVRRVFFSIAQLLTAFAIITPIGFGIIAAALSVDVTNVAGSLVVFFGLLLLGLVLNVTIPRVLKLFMRADVVYRLYGFRWWAYENLRRLSNFTVYNYMFGDSSYVVPYLKAVGVDLGKDVQQSGSNFGVSHRWNTPFLSHVGRGTLISDGLQFVNVDFSSSSFVLQHVSIGVQNFLGNSIVLPAQSRVGDNCLLATKVMVPTAGEMRKNVGLLGSPAFEIPRSVRRDERFDQYKTGAEFNRRLAAKNRSNLATIALFLISRWMFLYALILILSLIGNSHDTYDPISVALGLFATLGFTLFFWILIEKVSVGLRRLSPHYCSIYEPYYWFHERYWKINETRWISLFDGTPFKPLIWRLLGVRVGKKLYDDGSEIIEKTLVDIGDHCTLGASTIMQSHSLEDGTFKSDHIKIGNRCTLETRSFTHYGVVMADDVVLRADAFLMKGETPPPGSTWLGNPAREVRGDGRQPCGRADRGARRRHYDLVAHLRALRAAHQQARARLPQRSRPAEPDSRPAAPSASPGRRDRCRQPPDPVLVPENSDNS
jgi:non-ribosomal peptide synthetase-like protein